MEAIPGIAIIKINERQARVSKFTKVRIFMTPLKLYNILVKKTYLFLSVNVTRLLRGRKFKISKDANKYCSLLIFRKQKKIFQ